MTTHSVTTQYACDLNKYELSLRLAPIDNISVLQVPNLASVSTIGSCNAKFTQGMEIMIQVLKTSKSKRRILVHAWIQVDHLAHASV